MKKYTFKFSQAFLKLRRQKSLTQEEIAKVLSVKKSTVSNWERDYSTPNFEVLCHISDYFNVSLDYLIGRTDDPNKTVEPVQAYEEIPKWLKPMLNDLSNLDKNGQKAVKAAIDAFKK